MALYLSMGRTPSRSEKPQHRATGRQRQDAYRAAACRSSVEHGASSSDLSEDGRTERDRKFALYCARNLIERHCDVGETNLSQLSWSLLSSY